MTKKNSKKSRIESPIDDSFVQQNLEGDSSVPAVIPSLPNTSTTVSVSVTPSPLLTSSSSQQQRRPLTNGSLVPAGTLICPHGLDYVYVIDDLYPTTGRP
eukprot:CAMPEP_0114329592 /NCGR_PEP_ID=MMETSP0101-20121206/1174_1 /TAXON_ID=38822 ORGANISM="Pteridomonas danica, Strain PT" /NCGR_SAMPLE_ID=MMETSP0101 /ASSEMBLY_ACC=CAM_ASM_000211 /LENGTH=99 /DNA_ID=CAMNT_0001459295 /DNA_START=8 /DNA_END=303 /DNA_ORIENTATION=+